MLHKQSGLTGVNSGEFLFKPGDKVKLGFNPCHEECECCWYPGNNNNSSSRPALDPEKVYTVKELGFYGVSYSFEEVLEEVFYPIRWFLPA